MKISRGMRIVFECKRCKLRMLNENVESLRGEFHHAAGPRVCENDDKLFYLKLDPHDEGVVPAKPDEITMTLVPVNQRVTRRNK